MQGSNEQRDGSFIVKGLGTRGMLACMASGTEPCLTGSTGDLSARELSVVFGKSIRNLTVSEPAPARGLVGLLP